MILMSVMLPNVPRTTCQHPDPASCSLPGYASSPPIIQLPLSVSRSEAASLGDMAGRVFRIPPIEQKELGLPV